MTYNSIKTIVMIAAISGDKFLFVNKDGKLGFVSEVFEGDFDSGVDVVLQEILKKKFNGSGVAEYMGSFLRKEGNDVVIGYNFLVRDAVVLEGDYVFVEICDIGKLDMDENTSLFLKMHGSFIMD